MKRVIDIPGETFKYYVTLANKGEQIGNLERIILDSTPLKEYKRAVNKIDTSAVDYYNWENECRNG